MKEWFEVKAATADPSVAEIYIFGVIGDYIDDLFGFDAVTTAKSFVDEIAKLPPSVKTLKVRINSPGGDVFGGITIANTLRAEQTKGRKVETIVEGLAASSASIIAMAGSKVVMADNALMMVHNPWSVSVGNAAEMRAVADILDTMRDALVKTYQWHSELSDKEIIGLLDGEDGQGTWLDADAAIEAGLATEKITGLKAAASIDPRAAAKLKVPERFKDQVEALMAPVEDRAPAPPPPAPESAKALDAGDVVRLCAAAALDLGFAEALIGEGLEASAVEARITAEKTTREQARVREDEIRALCAQVKQDDLAPEYVAGAMTVGQVKAHLLKITAKLDKVEIDAHLTPDHGTNRKPVIDVAAVYAERNLIAPKKGKE